MVSACWNFIHIFSRPLFTIIFTPAILKFHPCYILIVETMVGFIIYCVLICKVCGLPLKVRTIFVTECFLTCPWRLLITNINRLEQLKFKLEKIIGI